MDMARTVMSVIGRYLIAVPVVLLLFTQVGHAQLNDTCPPTRPGVGQPVPLPTGEKNPDGTPVVGWQVGRTVTATGGDKVEFWCLKSRSGTDYGYLYYNAANKTYSWMGGCFFASGVNKPSTKVKIGVMGGKLVITGIGPQDWSNFQPPVDVVIDPKTGKATAATQTQMRSDWEFNFDPSKNTDNLTVAATTSTWEWADPGTGKLFINPLTGLPLRNQFLQTNEVNQAGYPITYTAPSIFDGLVNKNGTRLDPAYVNQNGTGNEAFNASARFAGGLADVSLMTTELGGSGTLANPYIGLLTSLVSGDEFAIDGTGISGPAVTGLAATSSAGGWVVNAFTSSYVIFRDTTDVTLDPLTVISGFDYSSTGPVIGEPWFLISSVEASNSLGLLVPEPPALILLLTAVLLVVGVRSVRSPQGLRR
jgi:hypothetical protein